jgi:hypothetical protein
MIMAAPPAVGSAAINEPMKGPFDHHRSGDDD